MFRAIALFFMYMESLAAMPVPDWVQGLRSGEERLKLVNGDKTLFRRMAEDCDKAISQLELDIEREYNDLVKYTTELVYNDNSGCAVTASVGRNPATIEVGIKNLMEKKSLMAEKYAYDGLTYKEFAKYTGDPAPIVYNDSPYSYCKRAVNAVHESIHGLVHVCWKDGIIKAHCIPEAKNCWQKVPR